MLQSLKRFAPCLAYHLPTIYMHTKDRDEAISMDIMKLQSHLSRPGDVISSFAVGTGCCTCSLYAHTISDNLK